MAGADRSRRYRTRRASGRAVFRIEADEAAVVDMLVSSGHLHLNAADDPEKVRSALERLVSSLVAMDVHLPGS